VDDNSDSDKVYFDHFPGYDRDDVEIIFTKEGKGAGYARNIGLQHAHSEKVLFADADDFFNYCINDILDDYKNESFDITYFNALSIDSNNYTNSNRADYLNSLINYYFDNPREAILYLKYDCGYPWSKIICKDFIDKHQITFDETIIQNDTKFSYLVGHFAELIKVDKRALYCVTYLPSSITYTPSDEKYLTRMHVIGKRDKFLGGYNVKLPSFRNFTLKLLLEIKELGKDELYKKCMDVLKIYDIDTISLNKDVTKILNNKRKEYNRGDIRQKIKKYLKLILWKK
jgi:glycosyltransferase involved in cell wall biosynthesis